MEIKFIDKKHEDICFELLTKLGNYAENSDYKALAYLLGLDAVCREHINEIFDFEERSFRHTCFDQPWQTSSSLKTTRLIYSLFTLFVPKETAEYFAPHEIFCCSYTPYYFEAIKIRFPDFCVR